MYLNLITRKTCPCNVYPLEPHFYTAKLGYRGVYLFFLIFAHTHTHTLRERQRERESERERESDSLKEERDQSNRTAHVLYHNSPQDAESCQSLYH